MFVMGFFVGNAASLFLGYLFFSHLHSRSGGESVRPQRVRRHPQMSTLFININALIVYCFRRHPGQRARIRL